MILRSLRNTEGARVAISPRGLGAFVTTLIVGRLLVGRIRNRYLLITGFILLSSSSLWQSQINLGVAWRNVAWPSVMNGVAISFIFVPLTTVTMGHLAQRQISNATGMFNLMRNLGGSLGIAFVSTMLSRDAQAHQAMMTSHLTPYDRVYVQHIAAAQAALGVHTDPVTALAQAHHLVYAQLLDQARLWAFVDNFRIFSLLSLCCIPLVFLFRRVKPGKAPPVAGH